MRKINSAKIREAIALLIDALGEDAQSSNLRDTPSRVAGFYEEFFSKEVLPIEHFFTGSEGIVIVKDIKFYSLCEHHLLPFFGTAHVAYMPQKDKLAGISKIAEIVKACASKLQIQERLTKEIVDSLMSQLKPHGVFVIIEAEHLCMAMRGIKENAKVITQGSAGVFLDDKHLSNEAVSLISR
jgi:GTP cyclohydrolase I